MSSKLKLSLQMNILVSCVFLTCTYNGTSLFKRLHIKIFSWDFWDHTCASWRLCYQNCKLYSFWVWCQRFAIWENCLWTTMAHLLLVIVVPLVVAAEIRVQNEIYKKLKGEIQFNFTTRNVGNVRSKIQCVSKCTGNYGCIGVGIHKTNDGSFKCFNINSDPLGESLSLEKLVYLKGIFTFLFLLLYICSVETILTAR